LHAVDGARFPRAWRSVIEGRPFAARSSVTSVSVFRTAYPPGA
jgi:hypothetical protein